jgi:copper chaperone
LLGWSDPDRSRLEEKSTMTTTAIYAVSGMTCDHCVVAVTDELSKVDGVEQVGIDLVVGGESAVAVTSEFPLAVETIRRAVDEAGYDLAGVTG